MLMVGKPLPFNWFHFLFFMKLFSIGFDTLLRCSPKYYDILNSFFLFHCWIWYIFIISFPNHFLLRFQIPSSQIMLYVNNSEMWEVATGRASLNMHKFWMLMKNSFGATRLGLYLLRVAYSFFHNYGWTTML